MHVTRAQPIRNVLLCRFKANKSVFNLSLLGTERDGLFVSFGNLYILRDVILSGVTRVGITRAGN